MTKIQLFIKILPGRIAGENFYKVLTKSRLQITLLLHEQHAVSRNGGGGGIEGTTRFLKNITGMWLLEMLRGFAPFPIEKLHIIGGGSANALLNQWTADAQMKEMTAAFGLPK